MSFLKNFDGDYGTLGIRIAKICFQIRTRRPRIRLSANFGQFDCINSPKNDQLACFWSPCTKILKDVVEDGISFKQIILDYCTLLVWVGKNITR